MPSFGEVSTEEKGVFKGKNDRELCLSPSPPGGTIPRLLWSCGRRASERSLVAWFLLFTALPSLPPQGRASASAACSLCSCKETLSPCGKSLQQEIPASGEAEAAAARGLGWGCSRARSFPWGGGAGSPAMPACHLRPSLFCTAETGSWVPGASTPAGMRRPPAAWAGRCSASSEGG
ncbi:hypothetical protein HJG60_010430 [Phyllostomus discolor]|uniref:Uncharacterized protein n=1 Tax=Phyllostomus discolor TaxID=89673 RepID=A0A834AL99_9CHIR|nr:hypothetical protein HJG60_010430 [Phyllostomus discolor]